MLINRWFNDVNGKGHLRVVTNGVRLKDDESTIIVGSIPSLEVECEDMFLGRLGTGGGYGAPLWILPFATICCIVGAAMYPLLALKCMRPSPL